VTEGPWKRLARSDLGVELSYPDPTARGRPVQRDDEPFRRYPRVHLSSPDRRELYVELVRFDDLAPDDEYREHRALLEQRFGVDSVTALTETTFRGWPAWAYGFRWEEDGVPMERSALLLTVGGDTYRLLYDPRSELNARVLSGLTLAG
jgi:hypothetical protein